jgi:hypothetical protein
MNNKFFKSITKAIVKGINYKFSNQVSFSFILRDGTKKQVVAENGEHILAVAKKYDVELEGAC